MIKNQKNNRFRCALSWKSKNPSAGFSKSVSLDILLPILKLKNIDFYNIQYSDEDEEVELFYKKHNIPIKRIKDLDTFNDIEGLVNFINSCDFTITVSNTNAHLSASIGKLTFLLLPAEMGRFWWWDNEINGQNVWYPAIRKYNQKNRLDWEDPINKLKDDIEQLIENFS